MATTTKTTFTGASVTEFIETFVVQDQKKKDAYDLIKIFEQISGWEAKMWGSSIIGFGAYYYKYASGHEGVAPILGFSSRKTALSLYCYIGTEDQDDMLTRLGKFTKGKACIYVKKLADVDTKVIEELSLSSIQLIKEKYTIL